MVSEAWGSPSWYLEAWPKSTSTVGGSSSSSSSSGSEQGFQSFSFSDTDGLHVRLHVRSGQPIRIRFLSEMCNMLRHLSLSSVHTLSRRLARRWPGPSAPLQTSTKIPKRSINESIKRQVWGEETLISGETDVLPFPPGLHLHNKYCQFMDLEQRIQKHTHTHSHTGTAANRLNKRSDELLTAASWFLRLLRGLRLPMC